MRTVDVQASLPKPGERVFFPYGESVRTGKVKSAAAHVGAAGVSLSATVEVTDPEDGATWDCVVSAGECFDSPDAAARFAFNHLQDAP